LNNRGELHTGNGVGGVENMSGGVAAAVGEGGEEGTRLDRVRENLLIYTSGNGGWGEW
jgi:hypothetical protein